MVKVGKTITAGGSGKPGVSPIIQGGDTVSATVQVGFMGAAV